ncbi:hypothetical protein AHY55_25415, partial [Salmonella enterica subsp. enterica]|nr:hypothetical protein [Salmonella enterica subsp. enterica serovar Wandsworth]
MKKITKSIPLRTGAARSVCSRLKGMIAVLCAVIPGVSVVPVQAALPAALPGAGVLGNTLPSAPQPVSSADAGSLTLPALTPSVAGTPAQSGRAIVLRRVNIGSATGPSGLSVLSGELLQRLQTIADSHTGVPQHFSDLQAMVQAMTR